MKNLFFFICICLSIQFSIGQESNTKKTITISGTVIDSETKEALEYATVSFKEINKDQIIGTTTDRKGKFKIRITTGIYTIKVDFLSFDSFEIKSRELLTNFNLGIISLKTNSNNLDEVEVVAEKKLVEYKVNKKIYNASNDIANIGGNAIDVLNNTPSVRVDDDNNIIVRGSSATILIDGKPQFGLSSIDILKAIPSSSIDKVEIITRSAKYSAEGSGAILNIVTKKRKGTGLNGSIELHTGIPNNHGFSTFLNENKDHINLYSTISFNNVNRDKFTNINQPLLNFLEKQIEDQQRNSFLFNIGSDFYLDAKNTITTSFFVSTNNKQFVSDLNATNYTRNVDDVNDVSRIEAAINYTTKFNDNGEQLSFDFKYDNTNSKSNADINEAQVTENIFQNSTKNQLFDNFLFQLDYTHPITENKSIELGYKGTIRQYNNDFNVSQFDDMLDDFIVINGLDNIITYDEDVHAFYAQYNATHDKLSYSLGLRTENTNVITGELNKPSIKKNYTDLFPSGSLAYEFENGNYLSINYSQSINRPDPSQINPFISFANERFQTVGNQNLNPFYDNYLEILFDTSFGKLNLTSSFFLNFASDHFLSVIENTGEQTADGQDIFRRIPINSGDKNVLGLDLDITYKPFKWLRLNSYISPYNLKIVNAIDESYNNNSTVWYAASSALFTIKNGLKINVQHAHQSPIKNGLTELRTINFYNLTISKDLFKKKASLTFRVKDIFNSKKFRYNSFEANTQILRDVRFENQYLLSFTYRFNQKRRSSKDRSRELTKDALEDKQDEKM